MEYDHRWTVCVASVSYTVPEGLRHEMAVSRATVVQDRGLIQLPGWRVPSTGGCLTDCSLIIPTYRRPTEVVALLYALLALPDSPGEVVVVDGSPDRRTEAALQPLRAQPLPFDLVYVASPSGLTRQRNVGIDVSRGTFVFFLDDDCVPYPGYFRAVRQVFLQDKAAKIGAVTGFVTNEATARPSVRWRLRRAFGLAPRVEPGMYDPSGTSVPRRLATPFEGVRGVDILAGCTMGFRRSVLERHRFSEFFAGYSQGEDLEISLRVRRQWQIVWCADARVHHDQSRSGRPDAARKGYMEVRNRCFIRGQYSAEASPQDDLRFWLDMGFLIMIDLAALCRRPWRGERLLHAFGVARGVTHCLVAPPRYEEPAPRRQYELGPECFSVRPDRNA